MLRSLLIESRLISQDRYVIDNGWIAPIVTPTGRCVWIHRGHIAALCSTQALGDRYAALIESVPVG